MINHRNPFVIAVAAPHNYTLSRQNFGSQKYEGQLCNTKGSQTWYVQAIAINSGEPFFFVPRLSAHSLCKKQMVSFCFVRRRNLNIHLQAK